LIYTKNINTKIFASRTTSLPPPPLYERAMAELKFSES